MGQSTDGQISYGVKFDEEFEFPWDDDKYDHDPEDWWIDVNGYKPPFELFDERGEYLGDVEPPDDDIEKYCAHRRKFLKKNPLPFELVNYCSGDYPAYILAVPGSVVTAGRGYPEPIDPDEIANSVNPDDRDKLVEFVKKYLGLKNPKPKFWLSSYWG